MARNWPSTLPKRLALGVIDGIGYTLAGAFRFFRAPKDGTPIRKILVVEPWRIGDVVLVTPLLAELREKFPYASITLLAKPHANEILQGSGLVDEIVEADLPWTRDRGKYRITKNERRRLRETVRRLQSGSFDLLLDARGDARAHLFAALTRARRTVGYDLGGGWLLTDAVATNPDERHKIGDWMNLLSAIGVDASAARAPRLRADAARVAAARKDLHDHEADRRPVIGFHPGASYAGKRWPLENFAGLSSELRARLGGSTLVFVDPDGYGEVADWEDGAFRVRRGIPDLMAYLECCDLFICNDSGPMHLADALGVPLVAIFERGNPQWFGPSGKHARVVMGALAGKGTSAAPVDEPPAHPVEMSVVLAKCCQLAEELGFTAVEKGS